jgi:hypothetical protein
LVISEPCILARIVKLSFVCADHLSNLLI